MSWVEIEKLTIGGGDDYSELESTDMPGCKPDNKKTNLKAIESSHHFLLFVSV